MAEYMEYEWRAQTADTFGRGVEEKGKQSPPATPEKRAIFIAKFRKALEELEPGNVEPERELQKFLYAKKWDIEAAVQLILAYRAYRYELTTPKEVAIAAIADCLPGVLEGSDRKGRRIVLLQAAHWNPIKYTLADVHQAFLMTLDCLLKDIHVQANGVVLIVDWTGWPIRQSTSLTPNALRPIAHGLQNCYPVKFKAVHHVNQTWPTQAALLLLNRLLLTEKSRNHSFLHGNNLATLHEHVPQDILPTELGGERPSHDPRPWLQHLREEHL